MLAFPPKFFSILTPSHSPHPTLGERTASVGLPWWLRRLRICLQFGSSGFDPWVRKNTKKGIATHSSILAWRVPWTEEPGVLVHGVAKSQTRLSDTHCLMDRLVCGTEQAPLDLAHTCPFSHSISTLGKHHAAAQTQPWASQKSGPFQESGVWHESALVWGVFCSPTPTPAGPEFSFSFPVASKSGPRGSVISPFGPPQLAPTSVSNHF